MKRRAQDVTVTKPGETKLHHLDELGIPTLPYADTQVPGSVMRCNTILVKWVMGLGDSQCSRRRGCMDKNGEEHEATSVYMSLIFNQIGQQQIQSVCVRCPWPQPREATSQVSRAGTRLSIRFACTMNARWPPLGSTVEVSDFLRPYQTVRQCPKYTKAVLPNFPGQ